MNNWEEELSFGYRFAMLHRLKMAMCRREILAQGILPSHLPFVLSLARESEPVTQEYLACSLAMDKGTTARALGQLEKKGYVTRRTNPENRRENLVSATPKARVTAQNLSGILTKAAEVFVQGFTPEEQAQLKALMDRMLANARDAVCRK